MRGQKKVVGIHTKNYSQFTYSPNKQELSPESSIRVYTEGSLDLKYTGYKGMTNSSRFYTALKEYQKAPDPNILKEELWASRKEITSLEKQILEKTEENYKLKKWASTPKAYGMNGDFRGEGVFKRGFEDEYAKFRLKVESMKSFSDDKNLGKVVEDWCSKLVLDFDRKLKSISAGFIKNEVKLNRVKGLVKLLVEDRDKKNEEIQRLLNEATRLRINANIKPLAPGEDSKRFQEKIAKLNLDGHGNLLRIQEKSKENTILNEINEALVKENKGLVVLVEQLNNRANDLQRSITGDFKNKESLERGMKNIEKNLKEYEKLVEKCENYKRKYKAAKLSNNTESIAKQISIYKETIRNQSEKIQELQQSLCKSIEDNNRRKVSTSTFTNPQSRIAKKVKTSDLGSLKTQFKALLKEYSEAQDNYDSLNAKETYGNFSKDKATLETNLFSNSSKSKRLLRLNESPISSGSDL